MLARRLGEMEWRRLDRDTAIHDLFRNEGAGLVRLGYCLVGDRELAEEAVQEAFLSLYRNWNNVRDETSVRSYLRVAVINQCRSAQRRLIHARALLGRLEAGFGRTPDGDSAASDEALRIFAFVKRLPQRQREVLGLADPGRWLRRSSRRRAGLDVLIPHPGCFRPSDFRVKVRARHAGARAVVL